MVRRSHSRSRRAQVLPLIVGVLLLSGSLAWAFEPKQDVSPLAQKAFFKPELYLSSSHSRLEQVQNSLPNKQAWESFQTARQQSGLGAARVFIDPRSGAASNILGAFPLLPGRGFGNQLRLEDLAVRLGRPVGRVDEATVAEAVNAFVRQNRAVLGIDTAQLGAARATQVSKDLWQVSVPQTYGGVPVRYGRLAATINHGNLVLVGTETWGNVRGLSTVPKYGDQDAVKLAFEALGGSSALDTIVRRPQLEIIPVAPPEHQLGEAFAGPIGAGYRHRLAWTFAFRRAPDDETWEVLVDAHSGEVLALQDVNQYVNHQVTGGVYPVTSTGICPTNGTCGTMQSGWPMPFADTGLASPNNFTNSAGIFDWSSGTTTTTLSGRYVDIVDSCGAVNNTSSTGSISMGGTNNQHDCTTGGGGAGNTAASRTAFYEVNKLAEMARGWLPSNTWLQGQLVTNVNLNSTCNAFWNGVSINFYRSGGGCRNTGEIAGVFDHEWGHGLDDNDSGGALSNSSEGYADIAAIYRLQDSCVGHGFFQTVNAGCGQTADATGFNANENQNGGSHCDTNCSGVRDADWARHTPNTPDTPLGFVCSACLTGSGPCGRQVHCAAAPSRQAAWDFVARDLQAAPFNYDSQTAFIVGNKVFYQGSGNIGAWHACTCGSSSSGCGSTNGYMQWLAADDDNGNITDGTPHMTALFAAFNRHGIACSTPTAVNSGCSAGPSAAATLTTTVGNNQASLSWTSVAGANRYWVFRSEGHAGCNFGKTLIAEVTGTSYTDTQVANGRLYSYNVVAAGSSSACYGRASNCLTVKPKATDSGAFLVTNQPIETFAGWAAAPNAKPLVGDFNGDGRTDVALTGTDGWYTLPVAFSNGDGTFSVTNQPIETFAGWAAAPNAKPLVGDFNGDGRTDVALTGTDGWYTLPVAFSNGDGTFSVTNQPIETFAGWAAAPNAKPLVGDFNGDGRTDVALTGTDGWYTLPVAFSNGDGTFSVTNQPIETFAGWAAAPNAKPLVGDFNGDGRTDVALTGTDGWYTLPVAFSNGDGTFSVTNQPIETFAGWAAAPNAKPLVGDFNGDGRTDVALTGTDGWYTLPVAFSNGDGTFSVTNQPIETFAGWAAAPNAKPLVGDFNGDGRTDVALTGTDGWYTLPVAFSNGDGTFSVTNQPIDTFAGWAAAPNAKPLVGDFNGDGRTDVALTGTDGWYTLPVAFSIM